MTTIPYKLTLPQYISFKIEINDKKLKINSKLIDV